MGLPKIVDTWVEDGSSICDLEGGRDAIEKAEPTPKVARLSNQVPPRAAVARQSSHVPPTHPPITGSRVKVFWPLEKKWFPATVVSTGERVGQLFFDVAYDDGDTNYTRISTFDGPIPWKFWDDAVSAVAANAVRLAAKERQRQESLQALSGLMKPPLRLHQRVRMRWGAGTRVAWYDGRIEELKWEVGSSKSSSAGKPILTFRVAYDDGDLAWHQYDDGAGIILL